ncbi:Spy/CpxP family protein refolding chaperone [Pendulispora albinea]|uniref:Spy/CpxP family protein refolding chaperone n=1 Tax=Pendulispora albinea TaxID=2741071 RepID=A0ABZ2LVW2_9BACT
MHPGMLFWWEKARRHGHCGGGYEAAAYAYGGRHGHGRHGRHRWDGGPPSPPDAPSPDGGGWHAGWGHHHDDGGAGFGVRRPLRFLAHKLDLSEQQVGELANILNDLKTERAQAEVDDRRTLAAFADAVAGGAFDETRAREGGELRTKSAERLRDAVTRALGRIHALLDDEQRGRFAYLIRTGVLSL